MLLSYDPYLDAERLAAAVLGAPLPRIRIPMDAMLRSDHVELRCDLPGIDLGSVEIAVDGNVLTVRAKRSGPEREGDEALELECGQGLVARDVLLGDELDPRRLDREYRDGVLVVRIPVVNQPARTQTDG